MRLIPSYRPRASALHTARAGVAAAFCAALALIPMLFDNPLLLAGTLAAILLAGAAAGVRSEMAAAARLAMPLAILVMVVNPLVSQEGDTLLVRGWVILGHHFDVTLEALAYGILGGFRVIVLIMAFALYSACIDPDEMLRALRRVSHRSALTATLATRLVPVLARDARRRSDAARCRPDPPGRAAVAKAALTGALDRALDAAAALEVRGYARATHLSEARRPWSRQDMAVACATAGIVALAVLTLFMGAGSVVAYPRFQMAMGLPEIMLAAAIPAVALLPFAGRSGSLGVARA
ncbi:MAG: energy-coupling factor transport system permease protein [Thermoleophilaceae bacterium]|nr:energy-coupling factor transport system permease protein [Thermoleophilaceae bacterium]